VNKDAIPFNYPDDWMMQIKPNEDGWGDMWRSGYHSGVWKVSDFFLKRTLWVLAAALHYIDNKVADARVRLMMRNTIINAATGMTRMRRAYQGILPLILYIPRMSREVNAIHYLEGRLNNLVAQLKNLPERKRVAITTQSSSSLPNMPSESVDYIFTDPPFGNNIIYSEVNFIWEAMLGVYTAQDSEAIVSSHQDKKLLDYQELMTKCFRENYRLQKQRLECHSRGGSGGGFRCRGCKNAR
jgi:hypothetical protein